MTSEDRLADVRQRSDAIDGEILRLLSARAACAHEVAVIKLEGGDSHFDRPGREAEVLYWVIKGKTNKDIGDILGSSPMTVKKHLERIFVKMGVETRTAAAAMAMNRIRQLHPQFEG